MTESSIPRARGVGAGALALGVAASLQAMADEPPLPPPRPPELGAPAKAPEALPAPAPAAPKGDAASTCLAKLIADGASAEAAPSPATSVEGCGIDSPVRLSSITGGRRRREPAGPPARRLRIRARACRLCPPHRRAAWAGDAACQGRGNRDRPRLYVPDAGPHRRRQDQRPWPWARGRFHGDRVRRQASGAGRAADRRGRSLLFSRNADGGLRLVHDRPRSGLRLRSTPTTCTSTSNSMARAGAIAFANNSRIVARLGCAPAPGTREPRRRMF